MEADGVEYEERMELLDDVAWPMPLLDLLEPTYEVYRRAHPWVGEDSLSPKSVVRDMYERAMTFGEYVAFYGLTRSEGLVLRYLGDAYRALRQTVPERVRTDELEDIIEWLGAVVRQTDSSLLDEWEQLSDPTRAAEAAAEVLPPTPENITANERAFTVLVRNALFRRVELAALRRWQAAGRPRRRGERGDDRRGLAGGAGGVLRGARLDRHRPGRPWAADAGRGEGRAQLAGAADPRRPGRRPRLADHRRRSTSTPPTTRASWSWRSPASLPALTRR